uniref:Uncharacterized protein n=1 Tax=Cucumis melo subsp. melo TaxID=412675 RepID=E5GB28_CUCME|nr:hypothetical protein [Cucumis melo subsp. melo]
MSISSLKLKVITNLSLLEKLTKQISKSRISRTHEEEKHKELLGWRQIPQRTKNFWDGDRSHEEQKEELMGWRHRSSIYNRTYEEHTELLGRRNNY